MLLKLHSLCLLPTGKITEINQVTGTVEKVVYQRTSYLIPNLPMMSGYFMQRRRHVIPFNPRSPAQTTRRNKFADAVAAWQSLSLVDKATYGKRASKMARTGYNLFVSEFMMVG